MEGKDITITVLKKFRGEIDPISVPGEYEWHVYVEVDGYEADVFVDDETGSDDAKLQAYLEGIEDRLLRMGIYNWKWRINVRDKIHEIWKDLEAVKEKLRIK